MFQDPLDHLHAELTRLDLLLHREILRLRATYQLSLDEFRGLYISDEHVDQIINTSFAQARTSPLTQELTEKAEAIRQSNAAQLGDHLPWQRMINEFNLAPFEQGVLLLALAPEIHTKYETLYAYLNNDVTRKYPTVDLALRLFSMDSASRLQFREYLLSDATLFRDGLLDSIQSSAERPHWLTAGFSLAPTVTQFLLSSANHQPALPSFVELQHPSIEWDQVAVSNAQRAELRQLVNLFKHPIPHASAPLLIFEGRYGTGRYDAAQALCRELNVPLLRVDLDGWRTWTESLKDIKELILHQRLLGAGVYFEHGEALWDREGNPLAEGKSLLKNLADVKGPIMVACAQGTPWREWMAGHRHLAFHFTHPGYGERHRFWEQNLFEAGAHVEPVVIEALANRFILTGGQIRDACVAAVDYQRAKAESITDLGLSELIEAARAQSTQHLKQLAPKVNAIHTWDDLVLPSATLKRVKEIAAAIKFRHIVYSQWGFERRIAAGKGLKVLFSGGSGTGKTMTASVIARYLGLDLYKIDLSAVVSKYIGETEKNLDRIFRAADASNAILFFDEADALFGKRSEVKDAHDRYANIEIAYLLQKIEEYDGAVILASNLSKNIDEAFSRRMHYVIEFPLPDEHLRERLWRGMFPPQVPLGNDVDLSFLAKQFPIAGGDIQNVALDAAFLSAQDGQVITMKQLIVAMGRQMTKQGKIPSPADFKQYHALIGQNER